MWKFSSSTALSFEINCDSTTLNKHEIIRFKSLQQKKILNILFHQLFLRYKICLFHAFSTFEFDFSSGNCLIMEEILQNKIQPH